MIGLLDMDGSSLLLGWSHRIPPPLRFDLFGRSARKRRRVRSPRLILAPASADSTTMRVKIMSADALPLVLRRFGFLAERYGFRLARTRAVPATAWFASSHGAVTVSYDYLRDAAVDVSLQETPAGDAYMLSDLLAPAGREARTTGVRDQATFLAQLDCAADALVRECEAFLTGDVSAFRARHREAMLVARCRRMALHELRSHAPERAAALLSAMRGYWTATDRDAFERCVPATS
jgi:hypothetical protein